MYQKYSKTCTKGIPLKLGLEQSYLLNYADENILESICVNLPTSSMHDVTNPLKLSPYRIISP